MEVEYIKGIITRACNMGILARDEQGDISVSIGMVQNSPWYMIGDRGEFDCNFWHCFITLPGLGMDKPNSFIPNQCLNCWKVVARPKTLRQVHTLKEAMINMDTYSKIGIEKRVTVGHNYGAYWYCTTPEEGLERKKQARKIVDKELGKGVDVFLKRGCTEYESFYGDSMNWQKVDNQDVIEKYILDTIHINRVGEVQTPEIIARCYSNWVRHAYSVRDITYQEYLKHVIGPPLGVEYRRYDDMTAEEIRSKVQGLKENNVYELAGSRL